MKPGEVHHVPLVVKDLLPDGSIITVPKRAGKLPSIIRLDQPQLDAADLWARLCVEGYASRNLYERDKDAKRD